MASDNDLGLPQLSESDLGWARGKAVDVNRRVIAAAVVDDRCLRG